MIEAHAAMSAEMRRAFAQMLLLMVLAGLQRAFHRT
jgi:hypothetical protein